MAASASNNLSEKAMEGVPSLTGRAGQHSHPSQQRGQMKKHKGIKSKSRRSLLPYLHRAGSRTPQGQEQEPRMHKLGDYRLRTFANAAGPSLCPGLLYSWE